MLPPLACSQTDQIKSLDCNRIVGFILYQRGSSQASASLSYVSMQRHHLVPVLSISPSVHLSLRSSSHCFNGPVGTTPGLATPVSADIERYAARSGERFPFLAPSRIKDAAGVRPGEPGYNARTLNIPKTWFKDQKVGPTRVCVIIVFMCRTVEPRCRGAVLGSMGIK